MTFSREQPAHVHAAIHAYRMAQEYRKRVLMKWQKRAEAGENLRSLDTFHRTSVAWENDMFRSEKLIERATQVLLSNIRGDAPFLDSFVTKQFAKCRDRFFLRALKAIDTAMVRS